MKMKYSQYVVLMLFVSLSTVVFGQNKYLISLENEEVLDFKKREFFIKTITAKNQKNIFGYSKLGTKGSLTEMEYATNLESEIKFLLLKSLPEKKEQLGLELIIEALSATEGYGESGGELKITFYGQLLLDNEVLYTNRFEKVFEHPKFIEEYPFYIAQTIQGFIYDFAMINEPLPSAEVKKTKNTEANNVIEKDENLLEDDSSRDVIAVGYQIGGFSLIGIDYEFRATDVIGIHAGVGYRGFTAGVKFHFNSTKDGGFINVNFKDGGFGEIMGWAAEYGARRGFGKKEGALGFHYQVGLVLITDLSPDYRKAFGGASPPFPSISLGFGLSW